MLFTLLDKFPEPQMMPWKLEECLYGTGNVYRLQVRETSPLGPDNMFCLDFSVVVPSLFFAELAFENMLYDEGIITELEKKHIPRIGGIITKKMANGLDYQVATFILDKDRHSKWLECKKALKIFWQRFFTK